jgi:ABC-type Fe3+-hydroxamate transport system substrate-binding protein
MAVLAGAKITAQQVADAQPEVIVLAWAATKNQSRILQAYKVTSWRNVPAIRNRQVYVLRDEWLNTPGPPLIRGARALQKIFLSQVRPDSSASQVAEAPRLRKSASQS